MSQNPFQNNSYQNNPYQSNPYQPNPYQPQGGPPMRPGPMREDILSRLRPPAIALMSVAAFALFLGVVNVLLEVLVAAGVFQFPRRAGNQLAADPMIRASAQIGGAIFMMGYHGVILYGAKCMYAGRSFGLAMAASVLAVIPCCSPCLVLGIPFCIWSLVLLSDSQVKSAFTD